MGRRGLRRHERQLQMIDYPIHDGNLRDEGDDLHSAAALGTDHRINLIDLPDHLRPALGGDALQVLLFGHYHVDPASAGKIFHGKWGIKRCYNAGTSTHKNGHVGFQRVIDLSNADPMMDYDGNFI
jgi:hypothetical protein